MNVDVLIVGGGVFGLNTAYFLAKLGAKVAIVDADKIGSGASGGILGALMPYLPNSWHQKKQFQYEALLSLEQHCSDLENLTGISSGYGRVGRIMPIKKQGFQTQVEHRNRHAKINWGGEFEYSIKEVEEFTGLLYPEKTPLGVMYDNFSARIYPKYYIQALHQALIKMHVPVIENQHLKSNDLISKKIILDSGKTLNFNHSVISAGYHSFYLLYELNLPKLGLGVAGEAILLKSKMDFDFVNTPVIYEDNLYIILHKNRQIAIGSTSIPWDNEHEFPTPDKEVASGLLKRATAISPLLKEAQMIEQWAGVRPKAELRNPIIGKLPNYDHLYLASGGFKIGLGIAHKIGAYLAHEICNSNNPHSLPENFSLAYHLDNNNE